MMLGLYVCNEKEKENNNVMVSPTSPCLRSPLRDEWHGVVWVVWVYVSTQVSKCQEVVHHI